MTQEVLKAINNVSKRLNEIELKLNNYFLEKHQTNSDAIIDTDIALMELATQVAKLEEKDREDSK